MNKLRRIGVVLLIVALFVSTLSVGFAQTVTLRARMGSNVRSGPGASYKVIGHISHGKTVKGVLGKGEGGAMWLMITSKKFGGKTGFVSAYCLQKPNAKTFKVKVTKNCIVRSAPDKNASRVGLAYKGKKYSATEYKSGWVRINKGWIYSGYCKKA